VAAALLLEEFVLVVQDFELLLVGVKFLPEAFNLILELLIVFRYPLVVSLDILSIRFDFYIHHRLSGV
jgi:hypothetical protein